MNIRHRWFGNRTVFHDLLDPFFRNFRLELGNRLFDRHRSQIPFDPVPDRYGSGLRIAGTNDQHIGNQLQLGIEIPDSRYIDFTRVGAAQLLADNACASWMILGPEVKVAWKGRDLAEHEVRVLKNGAEVAVGSGRNVLGSPLKALTWLVNDLRRRGQMLYRHQFVTTGTCVTPVPIAPGDALVADFGEFGQARMTFSSN